MRFSTILLRLVIGSLAPVAFCLIFHGPASGQVSEMVPDLSKRSTLAVERKTPKPLENHPGNIFLAGERVSFHLPVNVSGTPASWEMSDDAGETVSEGAIGGEALGPWTEVTVGVLGIGWYRIDLLDADGKHVGWTTAGVIAPLKQPTPQDSPICLDTSTSGFTWNNPTEQERFGALAAMAGMNWIRDRFHRDRIETARREYVQDITYESSSRIRYGRD